MNEYDARADGLSLNEYRRRLGFPPSPLDCWVPLGRRPGRLARLWRWMHGWRR